MDINLKYTPKGQHYLRFISTGKWVERIYFEYTGVAARGRLGVVLTAEEGSASCETAREGPPGHTC